VDLISLPSLLLAIASSEFSDSSYGHKEGSGNHLSQGKKKSGSVADLETRSLGARDNGD